VDFWKEEKKGYLKMLFVFKTVEVWIPTRWCHHRPPHRKVEEDEDLKGGSSHVFVERGNFVPNVFLCS